MDISDDGDDNAGPSEMLETPSNAETVSGMIDFLKAEHFGCLDRGEL